MRAIRRIPWSFSVALFGKYGFRDAIPNLIEALDSASLNVVDAAIVSLRCFYPDAPASFRSVGAARTHFVTRHANDSASERTRVLEARP